MRTGKLGVRGLHVGERDAGGNPLPRIDAITVYAVAVERMTGKETALPPLSEQWPAKDRADGPRLIAGG